LSPPKKETGGAIVSRRPSGRVSGGCSGHPLRGSAEFADHQLVALAPLGQFSLHVRARTAGVLRLRDDGNGGSIGALANRLQLAIRLQVARLGDDGFAGAAGVDCLRLGGEALALQGFAAIDLPWRPRR
jgi:hypothetical protein